MSKSTLTQQIAPLSLSATLCLTGAVWLATATITPQIAQAKMARLEVALDHQTDEGYQSLLRRAEAIARAAAQRSFDVDILVTEVAVTILGENKGAIAPILLLEVSRQAWKSRPDPQIWATYFPGTQLLLGFETPQEPPANLPAQTQPTAPTSTQQPPLPAPAPTIIEIPGNPPQGITIPPAPPTIPQTTEPIPPVPETTTNELPPAPEAVPETTTNELPPAPETNTPSPEESPSEPESPNTPTN